MNKITFLILIPIALLVLFLIAIKGPKGDSKNYYIDVMDGCEYLRKNGIAGITHKGNCTNKIHKYN